MSDSGSTSPSTGRRPPKVGVYVPRHRRGNDHPSESESSQSSTISSTRSHYDNRRPQRNNNSPRDDLTDESPSPRPGGGEIQRKGRGKFMGPGGGGSTSGGGNSGGTYRSNRENRGNNQGPNYSHSTNSSPTPSDSQQPPTAPPQRHPRGRDFDATVLRRYSDDENKPGSSFPRSTSYGNGRSNNNGNNSPTTRSKGRGNDLYNSRRPDRSEEGPSRRQSPRSAEDRERDLEENTKADGEVDSGLSALVEKINLSEGGERKSEPESPEELEEWELALQDSDEDAIPRIESPKATKASKPHPAEHLLSSPSPKPSKTGNWSEVADDDMYILELYDFSPSIKTVHLTDMFAPFENRLGGFRIKWVDDTKALVIFESAAVAKQAYISNITNQIAKIKPYAGADKDTIRNAGNPSSGAFNGVRPAKTDSVARRLVQGALGLRVRRTPEQIAEEKALVQAAKEAREAQRQEQLKQRQENDAMFHS
ncbi:R3H and coiled-coil domain-containing protein 1 [Mortierella sp. AD011]|nr:R3H and coiled-coil domain-containing protein 1 [Mortierella sp. AD010]KAF9389725.1 R3H and coiled-coil domain-containing protein 1 [Mortierella sp. AD011]